jgi:hypothetical protein
MSVSAIGSTPVMPKPPERSERPAPDRDSDSDDKAVQAKPVQAATTPGVGQLVDKRV